VCCVSKFWVEKGRLGEGRSGRGWVVLVELKSLLPTVGGNVEGVFGWWLEREREESDE
jgi:hypothetical protein